MIARLAGMLVERNATHVVVDCGGVGYDVVCSQYTLAQLPSDGERVVLRVFTHATENKIALYGFGDLAERQLFDLLITVKNVGPSTAIAILGASRPREIAEAIAREDVVGLTRIKGVGKKTAELLVVELHEKCELLVMTWTADGAIRPAASSSPSRITTKRHPLLDDVALALTGMGWRSNEVDKAVADLPAELVASADITIEALLRQALRSMPR
ncbi:MAG TPA: Holliday junction branch migration protein RuvA [Kofleriaceae bacterium]|jgi:Holliday junction DNA helicase RuvA|nr:Holliday junction branch migration protein RuvA [Kofleriaceae bacterium]